MSKVILIAENGKYVMAKLNNGQLGLYAIGNQQSEAEELEVIISGGWPQTGSPKIQLKNNSGAYVTLHGDSVVLDATGATENRDFEPTWRGVGGIALKGANGKYVSRETEGSDQLKANRDAIGPWESFTIKEV